VEVIFQSFVSGIPLLLIHFGVTLIMLALGIFTYVLVTPYNEIGLVKKGNPSAALSFSGALIGIAIPLSVAMAGSVNIMDIVVFGAVAIILQLLGYRITDLLLKELPSRIENNEISAAITMIGIKISISLVNAAALSV